MAHSFRDLIVWQRAMQLTVAIYRLTRAFPHEEITGLRAKSDAQQYLCPAILQKGMDDSIQANIDSSWASPERLTSNCKRNWKSHAPLNSEIPRR